MILCDHGQASGVGGYFSQGPEAPEKIFDVAFVKGPDARWTRVF